MCTNRNEYQYITAESNIVIRRINSFAVCFRSTHRNRACRDERQSSEPSNEQVSLKASHPLATPSTELRHAKSTSDAFLILVIRVDPIQLSLTHLFRRHRCFARLSTMATFTATQIQYASSPSLHTCWLQTFILKVDRTSASFVTEQDESPSTVHGTSPESPLLEATVDSFFETRHRTAHIRQSSSYLNRIG